MQKRAGSLFKGKVTNKPFYEAEVNEEEIVEQDLILVPDQIIKKDKSFVTHEKDRRDHEVEMARSELFAAAKDAQRVYAMLKNRTEDEGLMGWQQSYITLAADYLNSVADSLEHQAHTNEMTGGVLAGGMSNFEEGVAEGSDDQVKKVFKKNGKSVGEVGIDPEASPGNGQWYMKCYAYNIDNSGYDSYEEAVEELKYCLKQGVAEGKCVECGGPAFSEEHIAEAKDACYNKVKSRYKVWPSAYASGALVKCRKVGASNWGNKSKK
jgi:hypothetical protein